MEQNSLYFTRIFPQSIDTRVDPYKIACHPPSPPFHKQLYTYRCSKWAFYGLINGTRKAFKSQVVMGRENKDFSGKLSIFADRYS